MARPQAAIFHEGSAFHWFLHFVADPAAGASEVGAALARVQEAAAAGPPSEAVEVVTAFGTSFLRRIARDALPAAMRDFASIIDRSGIRAEASHADLFVWIHSGRHDRNFEVARATVRSFAGLATLVQDVPSWVHRDSRDLTGFVDGTENPSADEARTIAVVPDGEPGAGGSFVLAQRWVHDLDAFHALSPGEQEAVIGRTRPDSVELADLPPTSHVARVVNEDADGHEIEIYRRSVPWGTASEAGLHFLAFSDDLATFDLMLGRMFGTTGDGLHDRLTEFSRPTFSAYYFAPSTEVLAALVAGS